MCFWKEEQSNCLSRHLLRTACLLAFIPYISEHSGLILKWYFLSANMVQSCLPGMINNGSVICVLGYFTPSHPCLLWGHKCPWEYPLLSALQHTTHTKQPGSSSSSFSCHSIRALFTGTSFPDVLRKCWSSGIHWKLQVITKPKDQAACHDGIWVK